MNYVYTIGTGMWRQDVPADDLHDPAWQLIYRLDYASLMWNLEIFYWDAEGTDPEEFRWRIETCPRNWELT